MIPLPLGMSAKEAETAGRLFRSGFDSLQIAAFLKQDAARVVRGVQYEREQRRKIHEEVETS